MSYDPDWARTFALLPLPQRMRAAADVLEDATNRNGGHEDTSVWRAQQLRVVAEQWEREDAQAAGKEQAVEELAQEITDIRGVFGGGSSYIARKLIDAGWTKKTGHISETECDDNDCKLHETYRRHGDS